VSPPEPPLPCSLSSTSPHDVAPPQSIVHSPPAMCPAHFHVSLPLIMCPLYFISYPLRLLLSAVCPSLSYCPHLTTSHLTLMVLAPPLLLPPPSLLSVLHVYSSGRSANPGGSARGLPRLKGAKSAGPFPIPRKQLLR
jgi:hypothetical protein